MKLKNPLGVAACLPLTGILEMLRRLEENEYESGEPMKGSMSRGNLLGLGTLERACYMKTLTNYTMEHPVPPSS